MVEKRHNQIRFVVRMNFWIYKRIIHFFDVIRKRKRLSINEEKMNYLHDIYKGYSPAEKVKLLEMLQ